MYTSYGLQRCPSTDVIEQQVFDTFEEMYDKFEESRPLIETQRFIELRYEELVRDPVTTLAQIYEQLELGDFAPVRPAIERYASRSRNYKTNKYELSDETQKQIEHRWQMAFERFRYPVS